MLLAALAIRGHKSAHSFATGPVMAEPAQVRRQAAAEKEVWAEEGGLATQGLPCAAGVCGGNSTRLRGGATVAARCWWALATGLFCCESTSASSAHRHAVPHVLPVVQPWLARSLRRTTAAEPPGQVVTQQLAAQLQPR